MAADAGAGLGDERGDVALLDVAGHGLPAAGAIVLDAGAAIGELDVGELAQGHAQAVAIRQQQVADALGVAARGVGKDDGQLVDAVAADHLRDIGALEGEVDGVEDFERAETELGEALGAEADFEDGRAGRGLDLHVRVAGRRKAGGDRRALASS